jgi:LCP family protein required for cell wall assembly
MTDSGHQSTAATRPRFCTTCGTRLQESDQFCPECGADISMQQSQRTTVTESSTDGADDFVEAPLTIATGAGRRRRRRRRWYRRPLFIIPLVLVAILAVVGGVLGYRTITAFNEVNDVSTPPPEIGGEALGGDEDLEIDTGPAQEAVKEWEAAREDNDGQQQSAATETVTPEPTDDGDVIGPSGDAGSSATAPATEPAGDPTATVPANSLVVDPQDEEADTSVNILLMGVDAREGEAIDIGVRPDSLGILNLNEETGTCRILAIPRDSRVEIPGYGLSKVNHALAVGGIPFEMLVLENYLGITIDHYGLVDFAGLVSVVDAFGGVTVDNAEAFEAGGQSFAAGEITLDGEQALVYARYRGGPDGDFGRVEKQQQVMRALLDEANNQNVVKLVPEMWDLLKEHFRTDYGMFDMLSTANDFRGKCTSVTLETETIPGDVQTLPDDMMDMNLSFVVSDPADVQAGVAWLLTGDATATIDDEGDQATPVASPASTPVATPLSTPVQAGSRTGRLVWRHDQGW